MQKYILYVVFFLIAVCSIVVNFCLKTKIGHIDSKKVFNEFAMKKELETKLKLTTSKRKMIIDSLAFDLELTSKLLQAHSHNNNQQINFDLKRTHYFKTKQEFEEDNAVLIENYDKQILERIVLYCKEYATTNNYDYVLGTNDEGNVIYANPKHDITNEIVTYINKKYNGEN